MIVVGTTLCAFAMDDRDTWGAWLQQAEALQASHPEGVLFFAAIELDARGTAPFQPLIDRLDDLGGDYYTFTLDDRRESVTTANRLRHITMGQNIVTDYCCSIRECTHLLFMAADCAPPPDALPKLLELDYPIVGGHVPTYCLDGPKIEGVPGDTRVHMATAAFIMLRRDLFRKLRWRWDLETGMSDDPCMHYDALNLLGLETLVRHDVVGQHYPDCIPAIEHRGHDLTVVRS